MYLTSHNVMLSSQVPKLDIFLSSISILNFLSFIHCMIFKNVYNQTEDRSQIDIFLLHQTTMVIKFNNNL